MMEYETDSRKIKKGQTFIAIKGKNIDGHDYINDAIKNGAKKIIAEKDVICDVSVVKVSDTKKYLENELINKYGKYFNDLTFIGVTGTNGKTTTCYLTYQMLNNLGFKAAYIGTLGFYCLNEKEELKNTTPDILTLYKLIYKAKNKGCTHIVMEVSSQSLEEERIKGINFSTIAFTNLTQDHLDFHKSMDNYLNAKLKILDYLKKDASIIVNNDDKYAKEFINDKYNVTTIGYKNSSDIKIDDASFNLNNTIIKFSEKNIEKEVKTNLISKFNVYNFLTCYSILKSLNIDEHKIINETKNIFPPKGRCEIIDVNNGIAVIDYAHTPDAVLKVIKSFLELKKNNIITIVGCGGNRDPLKRPIMGDISCKLSDYVIFTNDNPRFEDPKKIINDIIKNLNYKNYIVIYDRKEAIEKGISLMNDNDILLILGKGHENYQIIGNEKKYFDDSKVVNQYKKKHF